MTKPSRRNSLIITIPLVAIAAAWVFLVFLPIQKAIGRIQEQTSEKQEYCDRCQSLLPVLERSSRELSEVRKDINDWNVMTPSHKNTSSLLAEITEITKSSGIRTTRFDPEPILVQDRLAQMPLSMTVSGSFPEIFTFLQKLEGLPQCIWVDALEIEKSGDNGGSVSCGLDLVIFMDNPENSDKTSVSHNR